MHVEHLRIPVGAGALHVERVGRAGPPVVLLHGFGTCAFLWRRLGPALAGRGYTTYAVDLLGHGESDRPDDGLYSLRAQADHVARLMAALRLPAATVIGQDVGALVALLLGASAPTAVEQLVLLAPPDPDELPGAEIRQLQRLSARTALSANSLFGAQPALAPLLRSGVSDPSRMPDLLVARYLAPFVGPDGLHQLLQRAASVELDDDARALLGTVTAPVLVLQAGRETPRPSLSWPSLLPGAAVTVERLEAGRLLPEDAPADVDVRIGDWLARQRNP